MYMYIYIHTRLVMLIPRILSRLVHSTYKWTNLASPTYNQRYNLLCKWDEPPCTSMYGCNVMSCSVIL